MTIKRETGLFGTSLRKKSACNCVKTMKCNVWSSILDYVSYEELIDMGIL